MEESGAFIIRLSSKPLLLAVSWKTKQGKINHGLIEKTSQGYRFPGEENSTNIISLLSQLEFLNVNWKPKKQIDPYITLKSAKDALEGPGYKEKNNSNNNETTQEQNETKEPSLTKEESKRKRVLSRNKSVMQEIFPEVPEEALTSVSFFFMLYFHSKNLVKPKHQRLLKKVEVHLIKLFLKCFRKKLLIQNPNLCTTKLTELFLKWIVKLISILRKIFVLGFLIQKKTVIL